MRSIQTRLTVYITAGTITLLAAAGAVIDRRVTHQLEQEFDRSLLAKAMTVVSLTEQDAEEVDFDLDEEVMPEYRPGGRPEYFQLWLEDGQTLRKSTSLGERELRRGGAVLNEPVFSDVQLPDQRPGRAVMLRFMPRFDEEDEDEPAPAADGEFEGVEAHLTLARGMEPLNELLWSMRTTLLATFVLLMAAGSILVPFAVSRGLRPLKRMAAEVRDLDASKLHKRVRADPGSRELAPIADQLNELLARLQDAFDREKRFSGNVAHELRTPIAELKALAEVGRGWPEEREMVEGFFRDLIDLADDMERTVVNLLMLARIDAGTQGVKQEPVKLTELVHEVLERLQPSIDEKQLKVDNRLTNGITVQSDGDKLKLIVTNILYNAVSYSPPGKSILIDLMETDHGLKLSVSNDAAYLSENDLPLMFERFWRKHQVNTGDSHAGLGLSLVKSLSELLGLNLKPLLDADHRFTLSLSGLAPV